MDSKKQDATLESQGGSPWNLKVENRKNPAKRLSPFRILALESQGTIYICPCMDFIPDKECPYFFSTDYG